TGQYAGRFVGNSLTCGNCHLNAGQREDALPLTGSPNSYPQYNTRAGREISIAERITECFLRSENALGKLIHSSDSDRTSMVSFIINSPEVEAVSAYLIWTSRNVSAQHFL